MEEYFEKYAAELEATEVESPVSEEQFMRYYKRRESQRRRSRIYWFSGAAVAAAALFAAVFFAFSGSRGKAEPDMVAIYIEEFTSGVEPIYNDVVSMEGRSELCSALNLSAVMRDILESIPELNEGMKGVDQTQRLDTVREYCQEQAERISDIYSQCITSYTLDYNDSETL
ncbi:MAG: hypothetical protein LUC24_05050 [Bacteroidales bacterium]|nr:hypothetical protein [Bacteroidales bacterium]